MVEDVYPNITNIFKRKTTGFVFCGIKRKEWSIYEENKFRQSAISLMDFYNRLKNRFIGVISGPEELAELMCQAIFKSYGNNLSKIRPGSFGTPLARSIMIAYMHEKGMISPTEDYRW